MENKLRLKTLVNGYAGSGKSYHLLTYPKIAWLITEPGTEILLETHPELKKNVVWMESFLPSPDEDIKTVFERLQKAVVRAYADVKAGTIETLGLDNASFLSENRWIYINKYERNLTNQGQLNTLAMYGDLNRWLYQFFLLNITPFPGHVVVTCHEHEEKEDNVKTGNVSPDLLSGFRDTIDRMFSCSIYLDKKKVGENKYKYAARCQKGAGRNAKNRYGLPEVVEDISYDSIIKCINEANNKISK